MDINLVFEIQRITTGGYSPSSTHKAKTKKDFSTINSRAQAVTRELELRTSGEATVICPISGLIVPSDLPPTDNAFLVCAHPITFNALAIADSNSYLHKLNEAQLAGLVLSLLHTLRKGSISPSSSAFAINLRMQALFNQQELLEIINWVFDNLGKTNAYYPPITLDHRLLHKSTFSEYTHWIASLSYEFKDSGTEERIIKPATPSTEIQIKRLDASAYDEWLDMASKLSLPKHFVERAKPYIKKLVSTTNSDLISKICSKVEAIAKDESEGLPENEALEIAAIGELFTLEVLEFRKKAEKLGYYKAQLDEWETPASVIAPTVEAEATIEKPKTKVNFLDFVKRS